MKIRTRKMRYHNDVRRKDIENNTIEILDTLIEKRKLHMYRLSKLYSNLKHTAHICIEFGKPASKVTIMNHSKKMGERHKEIEIISEERLKLVGNTSCGIMKKEITNYHTIFLLKPIRRTRPEDLNERITHKVTLRFDRASVRSARSPENQTIQKVTCTLTMPER
ncbi:hypothetical protein RCL_jg26017.t1 [Rhizophagus clarus]|uniref:Uncharacterized protein n=1 Tax=Rhizophagus clarus TaxID=94130 RepID=A0A8H3QFB0_9GLOM|nr:hypothetical protein RCL_jg26017.t1 [Rhizophagus clarus]